MKSTYEFIKLIWIIKICFWVNTCKDKNARFKIPKPSICLLASWTMCLITFKRRPLSLVVIMRFDLSVILSCAGTSKIPVARIKVASVRFATARAQSVFAVPGGPNRSTPLGGSMPGEMNHSGYRILSVIKCRSTEQCILTLSSGVSTTSSNFSICSLHPQHLNAWCLAFLPLASSLQKRIFGGNGIWIGYLFQPTLYRFWFMKGGRDG